ncbi:MAG TPA: NAD(P)/FAD-dependent oxidoreductase [Polyangiaceae bacterium]
MNERVDVLVIGAGVIGLAVARGLALAGREVLVLEAEPVFGSHTSSRNSEVIHAGIYYPTDSKKARYCVRGKELLYAYCAANDVPHRRLGKLIVAARDDEMPALERLKAQAEANGVADLEWLEAAKIAELEPAVRAVRGLFSPSSGIVDSHSVMAAFARDARAAGAELVVSSPVLSGEVTSQGIELVVGGADPMSVVCNVVINSGGLFAQRIARSIRGVPERSIPGAFYAKGHYFTLSGKSPFSHLVYPIPAPGGLGVHVTLDLAGQVRFGPDVSWIDDVDYSFDESREASFYAAVRSYFPELRAGSLAPGYTGIRPKLGPAGSVFQDFVVQGPREHGVPGLVQLFGIESPGLTASLALAEEVRALV